MWNWASGFDQGPFVAVLDTAGFSRRSLVAGRALGLKVILPLRRRLLFGLLAGFPRCEQVHVLWFPCALVPLSWVSAGRPLLGSRSAPAALAGVLFTCKSFGGCQSSRDVVWLRLASLPACPRSSTHVLGQASFCSCWPPPQLQENHLRLKGKKCEHGAHSSRRPSVEYLAHEPFVSDPP